MTLTVTKSGKGAKFAPAAKNKDVLQVTAKKGETAELAIAKKFTSPQLTAACSLLSLVPELKEQGINQVVDAINGETQKVINGEMGRAEEMLVSQAHVLDMMFSAMTQRAVTNMNAGHVQAMDTYMRIALKAQSQCRTTLEALSEIKNPRTATFIKQQNNAAQQQVNNAPSAHEKNITPTNELLEAHHGERLDTGTAAAAGTVNPKLAAVAAIDRAKDAAGKAPGLRKCT